jgi:hypothetical protein
MQQTLTLETSKPSTLKKAAQATKYAELGVETKEIAKIQGCSVDTVKRYLALNDDRNNHIKLFVDKRADYLAEIGSIASCGLRVGLLQILYHLEHSELSHSARNAYVLTLSKAKSFSHAEERLERNLSTQNIDIHQLDKDTSRMYERVSELMGDTGQTIDTTAEAVV